MNAERWWNGAGRRREMLGGQPVTVPLYLPNISHGETWDRSGERPSTNCLSHSQTLSVSVIKTSQLMLYKEIIAVCSQIHTKHTNTLCGQNIELLNFKLMVHVVTTGL